MTTTYVVRLRGSSHANADGTSRQDLVQKCRPGAPLVLRAEPDNPADPHAVAVEDQAGNMLGYLPSDARDSASVRLGQAISARVEKRIGGPSWWQRLFGITRHYGLLIRIEKGPIDWAEYEANQTIAAPIDHAVGQLRQRERGGEELETLIAEYQELMARIAAICKENQTAAAHRRLPAPIDRITLLLVKAKRYAEAVDAYERWTSSQDPIGINAATRRVIEKRIDSCKAKLHP